MFLNVELGKVHLQRLGANPSSSLWLMGGVCVSPPPEAAFLLRLNEAPGWCSFSSLFFHHRTQRICEHLVLVFPARLTAAGGPGPGSMFSSRPQAGYTAGALMLAE